MASTYTPTPSYIDQAFDAFYDRYAPGMWGLLVGANLPPLQAEGIFVNTMTRLWKETSGLRTRPWYWHARLVGIACQEGFPIECLPEAFRLKQRLL